MFAREPQFPQAAYRTEVYRRVRRIGLVYAGVGAVVLAVLILQDLRLFGNPQLAVVKLPVMGLLLAFLLLNRLCPEDCGTWPFAWHFVDLLAVSVLVNTMSVIVYANLVSLPLEPGLEYSASVAVLAVMLINYAFSEGYSWAYFVHTALPYFIAFGVILSLPGRSLAASLDYTFAAVTALFFTGLFVHKERTSRRSFLTRRESEQHFRYADTLFRLAPDAMLVHDADGQVLDANSHAVDLTGFSRAELRAFSIEQLLQPGGRHGPGAAVCATKDEEGIPVEISHRTLDLDTGSVRLVILRNIRSRLQAIERIRSLSMAVEHSPASILITDAHGNIEYVNKRFIELTGFSAEEVLGRNPRFLKSGRQSLSFYEDLWKTISSGSTWHGEFCNVTKAGRIYWEAASIAPILDDNQHILSYVAVKKDITEKRTTEKEIRRLAMQDSLTGLPNRAQITEAVHSKITEAKRVFERFALLYLDLNGFKPVNDTLGHEVGDAALKAVANGLRRVLRPTDLAGRIGGDEFVVILSQIRTQADAERVSRRIIEVFEQPIDLRGHSICMGVSIGIAFFPEDGEDFKALLRASDGAMYRAKQADHSSFCFADPAHSGTGALSGE